MWIKFFQEDNGNFSLMRLMCFISLIAAIGFGGWSIWISSATGQALSGMFLGAAFAGKFAQKSVEQKAPDAMPN